MVNDHAKRKKVKRLQDVDLVKSSKYIKTSGGYVLAMLKDKSYVKIQGKLMLTELSDNSEDFSPFCYCRFCPILIIILYRVVENA